VIVATPSGLNHRVSRGGSASNYAFGDPGWLFAERRPTTDTSPTGLTAVAAAVRLVSETIGSLVMRVYQGDASKRQPLPDAPQAALLQDGAADYCTSLDLWSDVATQVELCGNALIWKGRVAGGRVAELWSFPADLARIYVDSSGRKVVEVRIDGKTEDITSDVIHVRGWSPIVNVSGAATPALHSRTLSGAIALEEFRGRYFESDATPSIVLTHPGEKTREQRNDARQSWAARHQGPFGERVGLAWGGWGVQQLQASLEEAQLAELTNADALQIARMFRIYPPALLAAGADDTLPAAELVSDLFWRFTLLSRVRRIERAVSADREVFPDRTQYARFDPAELLRGDIATTASKLHSLRQDGMVTPNEGRAELGYPPSDDPKADELLETPVGAGANKGSAGDAEPDEPADPTAQGDPAAPADPAAAAATGPATAKGGRALSAAETLQKIYLAVGKVVTIDEARQIVNESGGQLVIPAPDELQPSADPPADAAATNGAQPAGTAP
jgi:HK97 family phage portal protein